MSEQQQKPLARGDIRAGDVLEFVARPQMKVTVVRLIDDDYFMADFGPVPYSSLRSLRRSTT